MSDEALTRDVRAASAALATLIPHAVSFGPGVAEAIQETCESVAPALEKNEIMLAVVGEPGPRRALMRVVLGEIVIKAPGARRERITRVRAGESYDYVARSKSGKAVRFARVMPDRDPIYKQSIEQAEREVADAHEQRAVLEHDVEKTRQDVRAVEVEIVALDGEVEAAGAAFAEAWRFERAAKTTHAAIERAAPDIPPLFLKAPAWWAVWLWVLRWMLRNKWREPLAAYSQNRADAAAARTRVDDLGEEARGREAARDAVRAKRTAHDTVLERAQSELASVEVMLSEESAVKKAEARVESLLRERARHAGERKEEFFTDLRDMDGSARGDDVDELDIEYPDHHPGAPPRGVVLAFAAAPPEDADGFVIVRDPTKAPPMMEELRAKLPRAAVIAIKPGGADAHKTLARFAGNKLVVGARLAMRLRTCIADVARARTAAEVAHQRRLGALETQRIPHPAEFRAKQIARSEPSIVKGAADIVASSVEKLKTGIEDLAKDWTDRIALAQGKSAIEACTLDINQRGKMRVLELLEAVSEHVAREMQSVGESLERWALDEIQSSYRTTKKVRAESLAPVASEITGEDLADKIAPRAPIPDALAKFRGQRFRIGLIGAIGLSAAGAGGGMLAGGHMRLAIGAGIGLAIGLATPLFKSVTTLRGDCLASVQHYAADVTRMACELIEGKRADVESGIRTALDSALAETLERLNEAITRLMTIERNAIDAERATLAKLAATHTTLEEHESRLKARIDEAEIVFRASS